MNAQRVYSGENLADSLGKILEETGIRKLFVVCGKSCSKLPAAGEVQKLPTELVWFDGFAPNPTYESVCEGVRMFQKTGCQGVLSVGGGSAMDTAKCVKLFSSMNPEKKYLEQEPKDNEVKLIAVPTTAGTGSEATQFAVIYDKGEKQSVSHPSLVPEYVILEPELLKTLPMYQRKSAMLDALCHALESWWSVKSTEESRKFSKKAAAAVMENMQAYLQNTEEGNRNMLKAANLAGRAINLAQTTAAHAMCYKITSLYGLAHGHAAALCLPKIWRYMLEHPEACADLRGCEFMMEIFSDMAEALGCISAEEGPDAVERILSDLGMKAPLAEEAGLRKMVSSVNPVRLKNNPVLLDEQALEFLYRRILRLP